jgi:hypothetical protein
MERDVKKLGNTPDKEAISQVNSILMMEHFKYGNERAVNNSQVGDETLLSHTNKAK